MPVSRSWLSQWALILVGMVFMPQAAYCAEPPLPPPFVLPQPLKDDDTGFRSIFDGKTLKDWDGDPVYWRVESGEIVGETKEKSLLTKSNSFLIWKGGKPADFELKLEYRISANGNSGLQYRSERLPGFPWIMKGYQADIDGPEWGENFYEHWGKDRGMHAIRVTGQVFDERGRWFLALPGQFSYVPDGQPQRVIASLGDADTMAHIPRDDWNRFHIIARGNELIHILNDRVMAVVIDDDKANRHLDGEIGVQVHAGPPMKVEFRNLRIKTY